MIAEKAKDLIWYIFAYYNNFIIEFSLIITILSIIQ